MPNNTYMNPCLKSEYMLWHVCSPLKSQTVVCTFNLNSREAEAGRLLSLRPAWFITQDNQGYTKKPCLEKQANQFKIAKLRGNN